MWPSTVYAHENLSLNQKELDIFSSEIVAEMSWVSAD